ncbi:phage major capsid protein E-like protein [Escherichia coli 4.0967]|uniref:Phage major capsid protein E-like protein n=1 Tax=Escherichia coli 4.0967 TaxID=869687 RepID=A0AAN3UZK5_ECOLX|nr:phage major capsid protein E-like protein [Escherichia coli 4.0967]
MAAYVSPVVEGKVLRHRGGETRVLRPGYVKPKHELITSRRLSVFPVKIRLS